MTKKTRMNKEVKKLWVDALNSGKYQQTIDVLCDGEGGFCCLGVLTNLYAKANKKKAFDEYGKPLVFGKKVHEAFQNEDLPGLLHTNVVKWAGIPDSFIYSYDERTLSNKFVDVKPGAKAKKTLATLNDNGTSFKKLAKIIEQKM